MKSAAALCLVLGVAFSSPANASSAFAPWLASFFQQDSQVAFKNPALGAKATALFQKRCTSCHGGSEPSAGLNLTKIGSVITGKNSSNRSYLDLENPPASLLYARVKDGSMPVGGPELTAEEKAALLDWIKSEASTNAPVVAARPLITDEQIMKLLSTRLERLGPLGVKNVRFITLHNLNNDKSITSEDLELTRKGLFKLLNSLSWNSNMILPRALDANKALYEIDITQLGWKPENWERLMSFYPYGIKYQTPEMDRIAQLCGTTLPWVRADWLVFKASRPPLYHELLQLPDGYSADSDLEKILEIDVAANIKNGSVARAGFRGGKFGSDVGSGVSDHNRLIERHETKYGAYWKSYDFSSSEGKQDLLNLPLGPQSITHSPLGFEHGGGEIIFNLPNGLQGYLLTTSSGKRINEGPIEIVRDSTHGGRPVINGISCISCHSQGMNRKFDQVGKYTRVNSAKFKGDQVYIDRLYKTDEEMDALFREDTQRFLDAVAQAQAADTRKLEPVTLVSDRFAEPLNLRKAAADLGLSEAQLEQAFDLRPKLKDLHSALLTGGITREGFIDTFQTLVAELGLGQPVPVSSAIKESSADKPTPPSPTGRGSGQGDPNLGQTEDELTLDQAEALARYARSEFNKHYSDFYTYIKQSKQDLEQEEIENQKNEPEKKPNKGSRSSNPLRFTYKNTIDYDGPPCLNTTLGILRWTTVLKPVRNGSPIKYSDTFESRQYHFNWAEVKAGTPIQTLKKSNLVTSEGAAVGIKLPDGIDQDSLKILRIEAAGIQSKSTRDEDTQITDNYYYQPNSQAGNKDVKRDIYSHLALSKSDPLILKITKAEDATRDAAKLNGIIFDLIRACRVIEGKR